MKHRHQSERESHRERLRRYRASRLPPPPEPEYIVTGANTPRRRIVVLLLAAALLGGALYTLGRGGIAYRNYFGATIFVPFVIVGCVFLFLAALFGWRRRRSGRGPSKSDGEPAQDFPGSEWHKW